MNFKQLTKTIYKSVKIMTILSTVALVLAFKYSFDMVNGYFTGGALPIIFNVCFIFGAIVSLAAAFMLNKNEIIKSKPDTAAQKPTYMIFGALLLIGASVFYTFSNAAYSSIILLGIDCLAIFILLCATKSGYEYSHFKLLLLLVSVLFPVMLTMSNNLVVERHSNSVENMLTSVFAIAYLVYILYEGKRLFTGEHSRWHFASLLLVSHVGLSVSVAYIFAFGIGAVDEKQRMYQIILVLITSAFTEFELIRFLKTSEAHTKEEWNEIEAPEIIEEIEEVNEEKTTEEE